MQANGCVFLPASGIRSGTTYENSNGAGGSIFYEGAYWGSTHALGTFNTDCADGLFFYEEHLYGQPGRMCGKYQGCSVRLVQDY